MYDYKRDTNGNVYVCLKKEHKEMLDKKKLAYKLKKSGLSDFMLNYNINNYCGPDEQGNLKKVNKYINEFDDKYKSVHLCFFGSKTGVQKTTIASYIGRELLKKGKKVQFTLMNNLIKLLTEISSYKEDKEKNDKYQNILNCDFLIIDDCFDPKKVTMYKSGYQLPFLDSFLRERLEVVRKATCFTSNFSPGDIDENVFGQYIKDVVIRNVVSLFFRDNITIDVKNLFT